MCEIFTISGDASSPQLNLHQHNFLSHQRVLLSLEELVNTKPCSNGSYCTYRPQHIASTIGCQHQRKDADFTLYLGELDSSPVMDQHPLPSLATH